MRDLVETAFGRSIKDPESMKRGETLLSSCVASTRCQRNALRSIDARMHVRA